LHSCQALSLTSEPGAFALCRQAASQAESYTYKDLIRDLDKEIENWQQERQRKKGKRAESVTDILGDVADEFLDFLEQGLPQDQRFSGAAKVEAEERAERARHTAEKAADIAAEEAKRAADRVRNETSTIEDELAALKRKFEL
jgi:gas vesicle protein